MKLQLRSWMKLVLVGILVLTTLAAPKSGSWTNSVVAADSVCFTVEQADSIADAFAEARFVEDSLKIELWRRDQYAKIDSLQYEELLKLYKSQQDTWYEKLAKSRELWLVVGLALGIYANK